MPLNPYMHKLDIKSTSLIINILYLHVFFPSAVFQTYKRTKKLALAPASDRIIWSATLGIPTNKKREKE